MATDYERMKDDVKAHGIDERTVTDSYIALKLFQIEEHMRRIADTMATEGRVRAMSSR